MDKDSSRDMTSKSWTATSTFQCPPSSRRLGCHTDPIVSNGRRKTSKRRSEESLERASKRSRTGHRPSDGCCQTFSGPLIIVIDTSSTSAVTGPPDISVPLTLDSGTDSVIYVSSGKRKSEETEEPRKRSRKTSSDEPVTSQARVPGVGSPLPVPAAGSRCRFLTSSATTTGPTNSRDSFEERYKEEELLGEGGFGKVFAGYRRDNNLPVAIKHISKRKKVQRTSMMLEGEMRTVPLEVALMLKLQPAAAETSTVVTLLDWYDLDLELILVLERPVPCMDLVDFVNFRASSPLVQKTIVKQLVDALIEVHSKGVFHRDIKLDNILLETGSDVPRVRLIDFGCGTFLSEGPYDTAQGTVVYTSPEWFLHGWYNAEPTSVWQLGVVLFAILHGHLPFRGRNAVILEDPDVSECLSSDCEAFLLSCLEKSPEDRPTLEELKNHPWLM